MTELATTGFTILIVLTILHPLVRLILRLSKSGSIHEIQPTEGQ